jgi:mono/diheme cytochrome c family protein
MKLYRTITVAGAGIFLFIAGILCVGAQTPGAPSSAPVYVPDYSHAGEPLPDGVIDWNAILEQVDATDGDDFAHFTFDFTNVAKTAVITLTTNMANGATTVTATTNFVPSQVVILNVHPSCGCTTAELPPTPWIIPPGSNEEMKVKVNLAGKSGVIMKSVAVTTDHGQKNLMLRINMHPAPAITLTDGQKMAGIMAAKVDRQAIFKGDCASCHIKRVEGLYGPQLFSAVCAICHEAENRATMVPDLGNLKVPTNQEFWRTWTTFGKPGSLMPAFASSQGGPLTDMQIASLAAYLTMYHPSKVPAIPQ